MVTLGLLPPYSAEDIKAAYFEKARAAHPDLGGTAQDFIRLQDAYQKAVEYAGLRASRQAGAPGRAGVVGRAGRGSLAPAEGVLRAVQQEVLRTFATTGRPLAASALAETADSSGGKPFPPTGIPKPVESAPRAGEGNGQAPAGEPNNP